ncbi:MAG: zinc ABC transporter substrate-binding protein [Treponema sp.]|jgi:zinc transport system substrate-binding protein|nr:zinc ABC transporter substrate-binding protein [Treponema sp.]
MKFLFFRKGEEGARKGKGGYFLFITLCAFTFNVFLFSCSKQVTQEGLLIAVSIPPQAWFVSQIAQDKAHCLVLAGPGQNPHNYEPGPRQIQSLASARAWILSGSEFEITLMPKAAALFPDLLIVDGTAGVEFRLLEEHNHAIDDDHAHNYAVHDEEIPFDTSLSIDRHTWLGREPAKILAAHIRDTLCLVDSSNREFYRERCEILVSRIDDEFDNLKIVLAPLYGKSVFVYHPSFGYFLDEFGICQEAVETGGKEPSARGLNTLIARINEKRPAAIFVQTQFPVNAAKTLASSAGAQVIELDPLAENWLENIRYMGQVLQKIIK